MICFPMKNLEENEKKSFSLTFPYFLFYNEKVSFLKMFLLGFGSH